MSAVLTPLLARPLTGCEYLLLGDLRQLLEEPVGLSNGRWILAFLDRVLTLRLQEIPDPDAFQASGMPHTAELLPELIEKLQRLRDRVALKAPYQLLANEVRCDLRSLFDDLGAT